MAASLLLGGCETTKYVTMDAYDQHVQEMTEANTLLRKDLAVLRRQYEVYQKQAEERHEVLETRLAGEEERRTDRLSALHESLAKLGGEINGVKATLEQHKEDVGKLTRRGADLQVTFERLERDVNTRFSTTEGQIKDVDRRFRKQMGLLRGEFSDLQSDLVTFYNNLGTSLKQQYALVQGQLEEFQQLVQSFKTATDSMADASDTMVREGSQIMRQLGQRTEKLAGELSNPSTGSTARAPSPE